MGREPPRTPPAGERVPPPATTADDVRVCPSGMAALARPMGGTAAGIVVDWLEWQLRHDTGAARSLIGANCRLCVNSEATIELKNFD